MHERMATLRRWRKEYRFSAQDVADITGKSVHTAHAWLGFANIRVIPESDFELVEDWLFDKERKKDR